MIDCSWFSTTKQTSQQSGVLDHSWFSTTKQTSQQSEKCFHFVENIVIEKYICEIIFSLVAKKWPNKYIKSVKVMGHSKKLSGHDCWLAIILTPEVSLKLPVNAVPIFSSKQ